ncbi:MAG: hypothetical protein ABMA26_25570 [Limisphaerales bacterium]
MIQTEVAIRVHPSEGFRLSTTLIALKEEGEYFLVAPAPRQHLVTEATFGAYALFLTLSRPGDVLGLWPIRLPGSDGRLDSWNRSALDIATGVATTHWSRVVSDRPLGSCSVPLTHLTDRACPAAGAGEGQRDQLVVATSDRG